MDRFDVDYDKAIEILEEGQPSGFDRGEGTIERSATYRGRRIKVVVRLEKDEYFEEEVVWKVVHVGPDTHPR